MQFIGFGDCYSDATFTFTFSSLDKESYWIIWIQNNCWEFMLFIHKVLIHRRTFDSLTPMIGFTGLKKQTNKKTHFNYSWIWFMPFQICVTISGNFSHLRFCEIMFSELLLWILHFATSDSVARFRWRDLHFRLYLKDF